MLQVPDRLQTSHPPFQPKLPSMQKPDLGRIFDRVEDCQEPEQKRKQNFKFRQKESTK